ncbi:S-phase kinase-associated protein 1-like [Contarinia nasturtii]|uniref:S-phase kinase-associated protein 1-like n=1 Tax=Contarinia nasturtii TaxID=265458 RepID=UPI0012D3C3D5|nr:S-phase kinase-associated protein 1-like [Contarinia nasturtii]
MSIKLQSSDGDIFDVTIEIAKYFGTINVMLEVLGLGDETDPIVPIHGVNSNILRLVLQWAYYHKNPNPANDDSTRQQFEEKFLNVDLTTMNELIAAANYLDIKSLKDAAHTKLENMLQQIQH